MKLPLDCFIWGLARDCAEALPSSLDSLESVADCFQRAEIVAVTNDSADGTCAILSRWAGGAESRTLLRADGLNAALVRRTDRLATLRNLCLLEMRRRIEAGKHFDLMIVFDLDGANQSARLGEILLDTLATAPPDWSALFANQRQAYYDIWALRHPKWCPEDCWQRVYQSARLYPWPLRSRAEKKAMRKYVGNRQVRIPPNQSPIEVLSAFGGLGIYKVAAIGAAWYSGRDEASREMCEHVPFNRCVTEHGGKLYIAPSLLNDAPVEHLAPGAGGEGHPWD